MGLDSTTGRRWLSFKMKNKHSCISDLELLGTILGQQTTPLVLLPSTQSLCLGRFWSQSLAMSSTDIH